MNVFSFAKMKKKGVPISMVTAYDSSSAAIVQAADVDCILVGDSLAMTMHGQKSTLGASVQMMSLHTKAVRQGASDAFIVGDLPFLSYRKGLAQAMDAVQAIMQAGANAVKLEGVRGSEQIIAHIVESGVPVMGHLGLVPQSVNGLGGYRVQGKSKLQEEILLQDALELQRLGCFAVVLECVPSEVGKKVSQELKIPTIGIGAGSDCDGQVLVWQDLLGINKEFQPKFVRKYLSGFELMRDALNSYNRDVKSRNFPSEEEGF